jgi:hypothetical protein
MEILLQDGRLIKLSHLYQFNIYSGLLCGLPLEPETYLQETIDIAQTHFPNHKMAPVVLEPIFQTADRILPSICTIAEFNSDKPARNLNEFASSALAIWFQDHYGLLEDARTLEQLSAIDWKIHGYDWSP